MEISLQNLDREIKETRRERDKAIQELTRLKQHLLEKVVYNYKGLPYLHYCAYNTSSVDVLLSFLIFGVFKFKVLYEITSEISVQCFFNLFLIPMPFPIAVLQIRIDNGFCCVI